MQIQSSENIRKTLQLGNLRPVDQQSIQIFESMLAKLNKMQITLNLFKYFEITNLTVVAV